MFRKTQHFSDLLPKNERICSGMSGRWPLPLLSGAGLNGYAPEKGAVNGYVPESGAAGGLKLSI